MLNADGSEAKLFPSCCMCCCVVLGAVMPRVYTSVFSNILNSETKCNCSLDFISSLLVFPFLTNYGKELSCSMDDNILT